MSAVRSVTATRPGDAACAPHWPASTLDGHLAAIARDRPEALAVVDGDVRLSYAQLEQRAAALAATLRRHGIGRGHVVTMDLPNWWEASVSAFGILRAAAVVNPVVPILRRREIGFVLDQADPRLVIVPHRFRGFDYVELMVDVLKGRPRPPLVVVARPEEELPAGFVSFQSFLEGDAHPAGPSPARPGAGRAEDIALLLYTSGTTADPKGVLHDHRTLGYENSSIIELYGLSVDDTVFMASPVTHITGFLYGILLPPVIGVPSVLMDVWDPEVAAELIEANGCRFTVGATPFLAGLVEVYGRRRQPCHLRSFVCGGADVPPELVRRGRHVLGSSVVRVYGSSECPTVSAAGPMDPAELAAETDGRPIGPVECRLEALDEAGVGGLLVRGPELFLGYLDAAQNAEAFTADGWFRTGDLATIDAGGAVTIVGRQKDIIVRNGENISAKEVEDLLHQHPQVASVAVVAMADHRTGEKVCAFVVPVSGAVPTLDELCRYLSGQGIARQKLPEHLALVPDLPITASGKVQKFVLRERARSFR